MKLRDIIPMGSPIKFYVEDNIYSHIFYEYPYEYLMNINISPLVHIEGGGDIWLIDIRFNENWEIITIVKMTDDEFKKNFNSMR